jgi:hypothetical protein
MIPGTKILEWDRYISLEFHSIPRLYSLNMKPRSYLASFDVTVYLRISSGTSLLNHEM